MSAAAVEIVGLSKFFGAVRALDAVSLEVPFGSLYGLLGPNGAGKTTLFSLAAGFLRPSGGTIRISGREVTTAVSSRGHLGMLPQDAAFQTGIPVIEQLIMFSELMGMNETQAKKAAHEALELVGLGEIAHRSSTTLSHGMLKRVMLCQAFLGTPDVIFLDEPTSGLDPENARRIRALIRSLREERTIVISSHNLLEIQELCDHATILDHGRVVMQGTMDEITSTGRLVRFGLGRPLPVDTEKALSALDVVERITRPDGDDSDNFNVEFVEVQQDGIDAAMRAVYETLAAAGLYPRTVQEGVSLEARFLDITGGQFDGASST